MDSYNPSGWARRDLFYGTAAASLAVLAPRPGHVADMLAAAGETRRSCAACRRAAKEA
jgi:hypothetical protein